MPQASVRLRVPFHDVDSSRRIHFTAMFRYMELAEHELMRSIGFPYSDAFEEITFPRVHVSCDFRGAIRYDDEITIEARIAHVGHSAWTVAFTARPLHAPKESELPPTRIVAEGKMTIVAMDPQTERARRLPEDLRRALTAE